MHQFTTLPPWPAEIPRVFRPAGVLRFNPDRHVLRADARAMRWSRRYLREQEAIRNSFTTGTISEVMFTNRADYTALSSFTAEASLLAGLNLQPRIPAGFFDGTVAFGKMVTLLARGVLGSTATPTYTFQVRLGTTVGSTYLSGTSVGVSAAITTASGVTTKYWELRLDMICNTPGEGTNNTTLNCAGYVKSPAGFASPYHYCLQPTSPESGTWTATIDNTLTQYLNLSVTCSASSASNAITCKQCWLHGWN